MTPMGEPSDTPPRGLIIVAVILLIAIIAAGIYFYHSQEHQIKDEVTIDLSSIAALKVDQIATWRTERLYDAQGISSESFFIDGADHYLTYGDNESREKILGRFRILNASPNYHRGFRKTSTFQNFVLFSPS